MFRAVEKLHYTDEKVVVLDCLKNFVILLNRARNRVANTYKTVDHLGNSLNPLAV